MHEAFNSGGVIEALLVAGAGARLKLSTELDLLPETVLRPVVDLCAVMAVRIWWRVGVGCARKKKLILTRMK